MVAVRPLTRGVLLAAALLGGETRASAQTFKVANWNIRSGMGITSLSSFPKTFDSNTTNCTDPARPRNAWGVGFPQKELARLNADPTVVALGVQEAWGCGSPRNIRDALAWKSYVADNQNGTSLIARHGFGGPVVTRKLTSATEPAWVLRAPVCLDPGCLDSIIVHVTHWHEPTATSTVQGQETVAFMREVAAPTVLIGDLNAYELDPRSNCGGGWAAGSIQRLRDAGYKDTWRLLNGDTEGFTGIVNRAGCGVPYGAAWKRIDYAWAKGLIPVSMKRFAVPTTPGQEAASDHYGILAEYVKPTPSTPSSSSLYKEVVLYASKARFWVGAYQLRSDATAAGGYSLTNPDAGAPKLLAALAAPTTYFETTFYADAAKPYRLWIRGRAQNNSWTNDSIYVQFSDSTDPAGSAIYRIGTTSATQLSLEEASGTGVHGWGWADNGYGMDGPTIFFASTGIHTIRVQPREDGLSIDQIVLSSSTYLTSAPGGAKDDTTIVPLQ